MSSIIIPHNPTGVTLIASKIGVNLASAATTNLTLNGLADLTGVKILGYIIEYASGAVAALTAVQMSVGGVNITGIEVITGLASGSPKDLIPISGVYANNGALAITVTTQSGTAATGNIYTFGYKFR